MVACKARTQSGSQCQAAAGPSGYCTFHNPALSQKCAMARKAGGRARRAFKPSAGQPAPVITDVESILRLLNEIIKDVWELDNSAPRARALLSACAEAQSVLSIGQFEERLLALERASGVTR